MLSKSIYLTTLFLVRLNPQVVDQCLCTVFVFARNCHCPSWISQSERLTVEYISWSISTNECCWSQRRSNLRPPDHQSDAYLSLQSPLFVYLQTKSSWKGVYSKRNLLLRIDTFSEGRHKQFCQLSPLNEILKSVKDALSYSWMVGLEFNHPVTTIKVISSQFTVIQYNTAKCTYIFFLFLHENIENM